MVLTLLCILAKPRLSEYSLRVDRLNMRTDGQPLLDAAPAAYTTSLSMTQLKQAVLA